MPLSTTWLRVIALAGTIVALLQDTSSQEPVSWLLKLRQQQGLVVPIVAVVAVLLTVIVAMPSAWKAIRRHPDVLVPLGVLTFAATALGWFMLLLGLAVLGKGLTVLAVPTPFNIVDSILTLSVGGVVLSILPFVSVVLLFVGYGAWSTLMVLEIAREDRSDPSRTLAGCWRWFLRILGLESVGWAVTFALFGLTGGLLSASGQLTLAWMAIGAIPALVWNLATTALLPVALDDRLSFREALVTGIKVSWQAKGRWWMLIVAQMLLMGWVTYLDVSYDEYASVSGEYRLTGQYTNTQSHVHPFWTGGYADGSYWYEDMMDALNAPPADVITTAMALVFGVLAIAVKLTVAERLWPRRDPLTEPPTNFDLPGGDDSSRESNEQMQGQMQDQMQELWRMRIPIVTPAHSGASDTRRDPLTESPTNFDLQGGELDFDAQTQEQMRDQMQELWRMRIPMVRPTHSDASDPRRDSLTEPPTNFDLQGGELDFDAQMQEQMQELCRLHIPMVAPTHSDASESPGGDDSSRESSAAQAQTMIEAAGRGRRSMQEHVKILGILHVVLSGLEGLTALIVMAIFVGLAGFDVGVGVAGGVLLMVVSLPGLIAGIGLLSFRPWARILGIVISALDLPALPFHTALGVYGLWVLLSNEGTALFISRSRE
jgi:hypothetical protein